LSPPTVPVLLSPPLYQSTISQKAFRKNYDPSILPRETYLLYEIKWSYGRRPWQRWFCSTSREHVEMYFLNDVHEKLKNNPSAHCTITCYMSWSPCGYCCEDIMDFLWEWPNVNLVIYVARLYWHQNKFNRQSLRNLESFGVPIKVMNLPDYSYCWRTLVNNENSSEEDYWPMYLAPWIMLYSLELQTILQVSRTVGSGKVHPEMNHSHMQKPVSELDISLASFGLSFVL
uniref:CMP/dCMP-type deaminase domain-containing protein n=1 Tax=Pelusios castaneus TaxID=367368 RepID=A0A8C8SEU6_9SAUR